MTKGFGSGPGRRGPHFRTAWTGVAGPHNASLDKDFSRLATLCALR